MLLAQAPAPPKTARYTLYAAMVQSKGYVVGAKLPPSGIFVKSAAGGWGHAGFNHPFVSAVDYDPAGSFRCLCGRGQRASTATGAVPWTSARLR
jgi:hypothetical protein